MLNVSVRRDDRELRLASIGRSLLVGLLVALLTCSMANFAVAGANSSATAALSWSPDSLVTDLPSSSADTLRLYLLLENLSDVQALGLTFKWFPSGRTSDFEVVSDSSAQAPCAHSVDVPPGGGLDGDSTFTWSLRLGTVGVHTCATYLLVRATHTAQSTPALFCLNAARVKDSSGAIDDILVTGAATIAGGADYECSPQMYLATPGVAAPPGDVPQATSRLSRSASNNYQVPVVTIIGNALDSISSVSARALDGIMSQGVIRSRSGNFASIGFPELAGNGPWSIVAASTAGQSDTLQNAITIAHPTSASFAHLRTLSGAWHLPPNSVEAWSPVSDLLVLCGPEGLYAFDAEHPSEEPTLLLDRHVTYWSWSPDSRWLACLVADGDDARQGLGTLLGVPIQGGPSIVLLARAQIAHFTWASAQGIFYWDGFSPVAKTVPIPLECQPHVPWPPIARTELFSTWDAFNRCWEGHRFVGLTAQDEPFFQDSTLLAPSHVAARSSFPDGQHDLVKVYANGSPSMAAVVDSAGNVVRSFSSDGTFEPTSVSADGRFIIGYKPVFDGETLTSSGLSLGDTAGLWTLPITGASMALTPRLSHSGYFVTYQDPTAGVMLGALNIAAH
jgi:hypothetical protein